MSGGVGGWMDGCGRGVGGEKKKKKKKLTSRHDSNKLGLSLSTFHSLSGAARSIPAASCLSLARR